MKYIIALLVLLSTTHLSDAQCYWQQSVDYKMDIDFDSKNHQFQGKQVLAYTNNSPDTLTKVFYHLYYNAFQPGSMMQMRRSQVPDGDPRFPLMAEIENLKPNEIGYQHIVSLKQNGVALQFIVSYTTLEVVLNEPILPGQTSLFEMTFNAQVPLQIRRTGRNSFDGVDYSMAQWYPKMAEYDETGWHTHPYVAREFYAPWGNFEVNITIDKEYVLAGTGILQNPNEIGYGYQTTKDVIKHKGKTLTWKFKAENVHDFAWAADPEYTQTTIQVPDGPLIRIFAINNKETELWRTELPGYAVKCFEYANKHFGKYGWSQYSIIQGGDGGMEYPMATLIINKKRSGIRSLSSLVGTTYHEVMHSWYQGMMATNESYYAWMDEGFTSFAEGRITASVMNQEGNPDLGMVNAYIQWTKTGREEPATMHADHFVSNGGYSRASYVKGAVALTELSYIMGEENLQEGLLKYYNKWSFKHPKPNDFIRVMENQCGFELRWFFDYWINTTHTIDYAINGVESTTNGSRISLGKIGRIPMPLDVFVTLKDGTQKIYYIPLGVMRGEKPNETDLERTILNDWFWTHPIYEIETDIPKDQILKIEIDPSNRMADVDRSNNVFE